MKTFILLCGLPGVGKSTYAKKYASQHPHTFIVSSDELRKVMTGDYQNFSMDIKMWARFYELISKFRDIYDDSTVIADATNLKNEFRLKYAFIPGFDRKILLEFKKPMEVILRQNLNRDVARIVPPEIIEKLALTYEEPSREVLEAYDELRIIN